MSSPTDFADAIARATAHAPFLRVALEQQPDLAADLAHGILPDAAPFDPDLPIVIITGYPDSQMLDNILKHGPVTVLKKPLQVEQLNQVLRILGHKSTAKAA